MAFVCRKSAMLIISQGVINVVLPDVSAKLHELIEEIYNEKIKSFDWSRSVSSGRQEQDGQFLPILQNFIVSHQQKFLVFVTHSFQVATSEP